MMDIISHLDTSQISSISIFGYCDDRGDNEYNQALSGKRALCIERLLAGSMLKKDRILTVEGKGELTVKDTSHTAIDKIRSLNRKVEIIIAKKEKDIPETTPTVGTTTLSASAPEKNTLSENMNVGDKITLENILFEGGKRNFLPESYPSLDSLVVSLKRNPKYHILILGHVCCTGGPDGVDTETGEHNLSEIRARMVYKFLISKGIRASHMSYKGMGGEFPTGKEPKYDRRVEIEITKIEK